ncbi:zinc ribbon domain-containing protein [Streptomyces caeni]|uniref:Zinc ribbon domain-containing protein n=1 Tax=Streptomyces caeni TaxID=2307231 RepID=A0ABW4IYZ2_9ACTN
MALLRTGRAVRNRARRTGTTVRTANPAYTSLTCPACGYVHPDNRKSRATFVCTSCGHGEHADTVGAKNTLARGMRAKGRGDLGANRSVKGQPA